MSIWRGLFGIGYTASGVPTPVDTTNRLPTQDAAVQVDDAAFTPATSKVMMVGYEYDDTSPDTVNEGDGGAPRMSARREPYAQIRDAAGNERGVNVTAANELNVLETNSAAIAASLSVVDDWDESDRAKVNPIAGQAGVAGGSGTVGATTQRVVLATDVALPAGTNLLGRVSASAETSTVYSGTTALTPKFAIIDAATSGDNTLVAALTGTKKIRVLQCFLVAAGTVTARFESGASGTALTGQMQLTAQTGFVLPYSPTGWFETAADTLLNLELSGAVSVDGALTYLEVPA